MKCWDDSEHDEAKIVNFTMKTENSNAIFGKVKNENFVFELELAEAMIWLPNLF